MAKKATDSTFSRPSNKYPFVPNPFGTKVIRNGITVSVLSELAHHQNWIEVYDKSVNMSITLTESDSSLWYLNMTREEISNLYSAVVDKYLEFETKSHVRDVFRDFVRKGKVPSNVSYLMYKVKIICGLIEHQDVDAPSFLVLSWPMIVLAADFTYRG